MNFVECTTCAANPGSPVLCKGCLANRHTIGVQYLILDEIGRIVDEYAFAVEEGGKFTVRVRAGFDKLQDRIKELENAPYEGALHYRLCFEQADKEREKLKIKNDQLRKTLKEVGEVIEAGNAMTMIDERLLNSKQPKPSI